MVRNGSGIEKLADLAGKKVAVPFVSTTHYSLLAALEAWGVDPKAVEILNLRPPEIAAAWERGDIDAAYVWDPALGQIKTSGKVLVDSRQSRPSGARRPSTPGSCATISPRRIPTAVTRLRQGDRRRLCRLPRQARTPGRPSSRAGRQDRASSPAPSSRTCRLLLKGYVFPTLDEQASRQVPRRRHGQGDRRDLRLPQGAGQDRRRAARLQQVRDRQIRHEALASN